MRMVHLLDPTRILTYNSRMERIRKMRRMPVLNCVIPGMPNDTTFMIMDG